MPDDLETKVTISPSGGVSHPNAHREEHVDKCPGCGNTRPVYNQERAELVCEECGLVLEENMIDRGPEWRVFDVEDGDKKSRVGAPSTPLLHDKGLSTFIGFRDPSGKPVKDRRQLYRFHKWQRRIRASTSMERNLVYALGEIDNISAALDLPKTIREEAAVIYRHATIKNFTRGRLIDSMTAAVVYAACKIKNIPRTLDAIAEVSKSSRKGVGRAYRSLHEKLKLLVPIATANDYVDRFCSELHFSRENIPPIVAKAKKIIERSEGEGLTNGRRETGIASAAIYIAAILIKERRTQREIASVADVTEVTIRNRYKDMVKRLGIDIS